MGKLGAGALGLGAGALLGGVLEHEWDKHEERISDQEHRHHPQHHAASTGGIGGLVGGFAGMGLGDRVYESETVIVEPAPVIVDESVVSSLRS